MGRRRSLFPRARRRRGDPGAVAVVMLAFAALASSAVIAYAAVIAVIGVVGALVALVSKHVKAAPAVPKLKPAVQPTRAPAPEQPFQALVPVETEAFSDDITAEAAALKVFGAWARKLPMAPRDPTKLVTSLQLRRRIVGRLVTDCEGRRLVWRQQPYAGREPVTGPPALPASLDPWTADRTAVHTISRHIASCNTCRGDGKVQCGTCDGAARVSCGACGGNGKVYGVTAAGHQRLLNCKSCRGRGDLKCEQCTRGRVPCASCHGQKRLEGWLDIEDSRREDVQVEPDGEVTRAFRWGQDGVAASRFEVEADARFEVEIVHDRALTPADIADHVPAGWIDENWTAIQPKLSVRERIRRQSLQVLEIPSVEISYGLQADALDSIELQG